MSGRQRDNPLPTGVEERADTDEQRTSSALDERWKSCLDVAVAAHIDNGEFLSDSLSRSLHVPSFSLGVSGVRVHEHRKCGRLGHELAQQLKPLRSYRAREKAHACRVAARSVEAGDEAGDDRVIAGHEHDWYRRGCGNGRDRRRGISDDQSHLPANQISD
jgi:hypothetical protein